MSVINGHGYCLTGGRRIISWAQFSAVNCHSGSANSSDCPHSVQHELAGMCEGRAAVWPSHIATAGSATPQHLLSGSGKIPHCCQSSILFVSQDFPRVSRENKWPYKQGRWSEKLILEGLSLLKVPVITTDLGSFHSSFPHPHFNKENFVLFFQYRRFSLCFLCEKLLHLWLQPLQKRIKNH